MSQESLDFELTARLNSGAAIMVLAKSMGLQLGKDAARAFAERQLFHLVGVRNTDTDYWRNAHSWCIEMAGKENYSWAGGTFAFRDPEIATMFKLTFG